MYPGPDQYRYFSDIYQDFGEGWFFSLRIANVGLGDHPENSAYVDGTWSDTSSDHTVNGGRLSAGTAHLHFRMAPWRVSDTSTSVRRLSG